MFLAANRLLWSVVRKCAPLMCLSLAAAQGQVRPGSLDSGFAAGAIVGAPITQVAAQSDGKVLIVGKFTSIDGASHEYLARLNADGSLDAKFAPPLIESYDTRADDTHPVDPRFQPLLQTVVLQQDGKILVGGNFFFVNGVAGYGGLVRLNPDGSLDGTFGPPRFSGTVYAIVPAPDGKFYVGGAFLYIDDLTQNALARLDAKGRLDKRFNAGSVAGQVIASTGATSSQGAGVRALALQKDGKLLAGGNFSMIDGQEQRGLARLNDDGSLDGSFRVGPNFNPPFDGTPGTSNSEVRTITVLNDGKLLIGGSFLQPTVDATTGQAAPRNSIFRLAGAGAIDKTFNANGSGTNGSVDAICTQPDGKILLAGAFLAYNDQTAPNFARLQSDGAPDPDFDPGTGPNAGVLSLCISNNGKQLLAGGFFNNWDGVPRTLVARVNLSSELPVGVTVTITRLSYPATEAGQTKGKFVVSRSGGNLAAPLTVRFLIGGTASYGVDYTLRGAALTVAADGGSGTVQIPGGSASAAVKLRPVDDSAREGKESVVLTLIPNAAYELNASPQAKIKILDND